VTVNADEVKLFGRVKTHEESEDSSPEEFVAQGEAE
jgi:hypothetical protein